MGLTSLFLFTLLGGLAAGAYVFDTCFNRKREGDRPWLMPVVVVVLFAVGLILIGSSTAIIRGRFSFRSSRIQYSNIA